jgi:hypothetical protein
MLGSYFFSYFLMQTLNQLYNILILCITYRSTYIFLSDKQCEIYWIFYLLILRSVNYVNSLNDSIEWCRMIMGKVLIGIIVFILILIVSKNCLTYLESYISACVTTFVHMPYAYISIHPIPVTHIFAKS